MGAFLGKGCSILSNAVRPPPSNKCFESDLVSILAFLTLCGVNFDKLLNYSEDQYLPYNALVITE